jgi:hypothetical protein
MHAMVSASRAILTAQAIETARDRFIMTLVGFLHRVFLRGSEIKAADPGPQAQAGRLPRRLGGSATVPVRKISATVHRYGPSCPSDAIALWKKNSTRVKQFTRQFMSVR